MPNLKALAAPREHAERRDRMKMVIKERDGKLYAREVFIENDPSRLKAILDPTRWKILKSLAERPKYPAQIAKELRLHEQKIYYHMKQLLSSGLVKVEGKEEKGGALAKYFSLTGNAFVLELPGGEEVLTDLPMKKEDKRLKKFLYPIVNNGKLEASIVVGSPDPHGPHQVRSRDSHYATELALFLGQYASLPESLVVKLDVDVNVEKRFNENMVIVGGILTNMMTHRINQSLPARFEGEHFPFRQIMSSKTGKVYKDDECGIIAKIVSPFDSEKSILFLAGTRFSGTQAAIVGLTRKTDKVLKNYDNEDNWACVVRGLDLDGDGKIDDVEVLE